MNVWDRTPIIASRQDLQQENLALRLHIQALNRELLKERSEKAGLRKRLHIATRFAATSHLEVLRLRREKVTFKTSTLGLDGGGIIGHYRYGEIERNEVNYLRSSRLGMAAALAPSPPGSTHAALLAFGRAGLPRNG